MGRHEPIVREGDLRRTMRVVERREDIAVRVEILEVVDMIGQVHCLHALLILLFVLFLVLVTQRRVGECAPARTVLAPSWPTLFVDKA